MEAVAARIGALALALTPLALGVGRFVPLYIAPGEDIWYQYRSIALYPSDALVVVTVVAWMLGQGKRVVSQMRRANAVVAVGIGALAFSAALSAWTALDRALAFGVAAHLVLLALFAIAVTDLTVRSPRSVVVALSTALVVQGALAIWQAATQSTAPAGAIFNGWSSEFAAGDSVASVAALPGNGRWLRAYGSYPHPNALGAFLAIALAVLATMPENATRWRTLGVVFGVIGVTLSFSRAAWLALAISVPLWLVMTNGLRGALRYASRSARARPVIVGLLALGLVLLGTRLTRLDALTERQSFEQRQLYEDAAWSLVARGVAVGAGNVVLAEQTVDLGVRIGEPPHNTLLIALVELGVAGIGAWLVLLGSVIALAWRLRADGLGRAGPLSVMAALLPFLLFDHYLWTQPTGRTLLVWALAVTVALASEATMQRTAGEGGFEPPIG